MAQVKMMIPALLFLSLNLVIAVLGDTCPAKEDIYPCSCSKQQNILQVECRKGSVDEFQKAFSHLRGKKVNVHFDCTMAREPCTIKASMFWDLKLQVLRLENVELQGTLDAKSREAMSHVTELHIERSSQLARMLPDWDLGAMKNLKEFHLWFNKLTEISNKMFETGPESLTSLSMIENQFQSIGDEAFASLKNLRYLWIENSKVQSIQRSMLPREAPHLYNLDFHGNRLRSLPEDIFDNMPSLTHVQLGSNYITHLPEAPWSTAWDRLIELDLTSNPLRCDSHMEWMFKRSRPKELHGKCHYPEEVNGKDLRTFLDENS